MYGFRPFYKPKHLYTKHPNQRPKVLHIQYVGEFCVNVTQAKVIWEEGFKVEKMPPQFLLQE